MVLDELPKIAAALSVLRKDPDGQLAIRVFLVYLKRVADISEMDVQAILKKYVEPYLDPELVAVWTEFEAGVKKGREEGELKGELKGELRGARTLLRKQLTQKFGPLSETHLARLETAPIEDLDAMTLRVLTAESIDQVLGAAR